MPITLYHATTSEAARGIATATFRPGKRGYAGAAIYFSAEPENAIRHCFNGVTGDKTKKAAVVIRCIVDLGKCLSVKKNTIDKEGCLARGYDSVRIKGSDTHAVYDAWRISIQEFKRITDGSRWYPSKAPARAPVEIMIAAIAASPTRSLNVTSDISKLCSKQPVLHEAIRIARGLNGFCKAHDELTLKSNAVTLTDEVIPTAEEILVEAIESAPNGFLDVGGDMGKLCAKHPQLRDALRAAGGLTRFCETHGALKRNGCTVLLSKPPDEANHSNDVRRVDAQHMQTRVRQQAKDARRRMAVEAEQKRKELEEAPAKAMNARAVEPLPLSWSCVVVVVMFTLPVMRLPAWFVVVVVLVACRF